MAETIDRGPFVSLGSLMDGRVENFDGPSIEYQAGALLDVRFSPAAKDGITVGRIPAFINSPYIVMVDNTPQARSTTTIAAAQVATSGVAMTLATTSATAIADSGCCVTFGIPIIPVGQASATNVMALDFGFTTGTTTANSSTVVVPDTTQFMGGVGQWIYIGGAGATGQTAPLATQITGITNATTMTVSPVAVAAGTRLPIGNANLYSIAPPGQTPSAYQPYVAAGLARLFNPLEAVTRNVGVTVGTTVATASILVTGYDVFGNKMTELITPANATTTYGKKAFKYILSCVPQQTNSNNFSVGIGDVMGFNLRSDKWEYANIFWNGGFATSNTGWLAGVTTPANSTTGDTRGTVQLSTTGGGGVSPIATLGTTTNGTTRLTIMMSVPLYNLIGATPLATASLYGVTQQ